MGNIAPIIEEITKLCKKRHYFAPTLFVKTNCYNNNVILIAIDSSSNVTETIKINNMQYTICQVTISECYSRIFQRDISFAETFNDILCLKDELGIAPTILSAIKPIMMSMHPLPEKEVLSYINYDHDRKKELTIKFNGITSMDDFIKNKYIPLSCSMRKYLSKAYVIFQNYREDGIKSLSATFFFEEKVPKDMLVEIQKYLYLHASELYLRNIDIPSQRPYSLLYGMGKKINSEVMKTLSILTSSSILTSNDEPTRENTTVAKVIYLYIITAKILLDHFNDFIKSNYAIFDFFVKRECSDNSHFFINNHTYTEYLIKMEKEFRGLCITNVKALYTNYHPELSNWNKIENEEYYRQYISQMYYIKSILKADHASFFQEYVKLLFACYDISAYYKAYVPYVIKYLNNEI